MLNRSDKSIFLDKLISEFEKNASIGIERLSNGLVKEDPFAENADGNVWFIQGNKLLRNKNKAAK